jgi:nitrogen fixation protein FixH
MNTKTNMPAWRSPWVLAALIMFVTVVSVNLTFIILSSSTNPGLVTEEYLKYGMQQNEFEIQSREQIARGWEIDLKLPQSATQLIPYEVVVDARNKDGSPLTGAKVELACYRPSDAKQDISFDLTERAVKPGEYAGMVTLPLAGVWDINMLFVKDGQRHLKAERVNILRGEGAEDQPSEPSALEKIVDFLTPGRT